MAWLDGARAVDRLFQLEKKHSAILAAQTNEIQGIKERLTKLEEYVRAREDILVAEAKGAAGLSEFLCARRYDLTPTGQDRVYPADGLPGKLVVLDNRCSLVRSKHLFLRPDLPSLRQARASRVKSAAQRRDRSHAQPPLGGEHGEDPRFDAAEHDASLGQGGVS
jgi:hypothetical protein